MTFRSSGHPNLFICGLYVIGDVAAQLFHMWADFKWSIWNLLPWIFVHNLKSATETGVRSKSRWTNDPEASSTCSYHVYFFEARLPLVSLVRTTEVKSRLSLKGVKTESMQINPLHSKTIRCKLMASFSVNNYPSRPTFLVYLLITVLSAWSLKRLDIRTRSPLLHQTEVSLWGSEA